MTLIRFSIEAYGDLIAERDRWREVAEVKGELHLSALRDVQRLRDELDRLEQLVAEANLKAGKHDRIR